jgi:DNA repair exonuclease SbcCD ATPase subunit
MQLLRRQVEQKKHKESKLKELYTQRATLSAKVDVLRKEKLDEQADVDRLECHSLTAFFYGVIGKMDEKLDKEREEAYAASVKYDVAAHELSSVEEDIKRYEAELGQLRECEQQYAQVLKDKLEAIKSFGTQEAEEILRTEEHISYLEGQIKEIQEALRAGQVALETTDSILSSLDSAEGWGTWDLLGGGLLSDMAKHGHLDEAQQRVEYLQVQLRRFKTELTDVTINADMQVNIDGFLCFADYFFDGLFADWAVLDKINQSQTQVQNTKSQIECVVNRLTAMLSATVKSLENEKAVLNDLIAKATI